MYFLALNLSSNLARCNILMRRKRGRGGGGWGGSGGGGGEGREEGKKQQQLTHDFIDSLLPLHINSSLVYD